MKVKNYKKYSILAFEELESTNLTAFEMALNGRIGENEVVLARKQSGGKGRLGRKWVSDFGNLYFSLVLRPKLPISKVWELSFVAIVALRLAVEEIFAQNSDLVKNNEFAQNNVVFGEDSFKNGGNSAKTTQNLAQNGANGLNLAENSEILSQNMQNSRNLAKNGENCSKISDLAENGKNSSKNGEKFGDIDQIGRKIPKIQNKWPNDLLINDKKVAGLLLESQNSGENVDFVVAGIGVNLAVKPLETMFAAGCLQDFGAEIASENMLEAFLDKFDSIYDNWLKFGFGGVRNLWLEKSWRLGKEISVNLEGVVEKGIFQDLNENGELVLNCENDVVRKISVGDVS